MNKKINIYVFNEGLLNNMIDKDLQAALYPLNVFQSIFLMSKFTIINNFITPKNNCSNIITSIVGATCFLMGHYIRFYFYYSGLENIRNNIVTFILYFDLFFYCIISIFVYITTYLQCSNTVELIIRLQRVLNSIQMDRKRFLLRIKIENWMSTLSIIFLYVIFGIATVPVEEGLLHVVWNTILHSILLTTPVMVFDLHMVNIIRAVVFIRKELAAWNDVMEGYKKIKDERDIGDNKEQDGDMFDSYQDIVKAFCLCNKIYQFSFTYFGFQTFMHVLFNVKLVLEFGKAGVNAGFYQSTSMKLMSLVWNLKNVVLLILLSVACENFYSAAKMAESSCAEIINYDYTAGLHKSCKNVLRLNRVALRKLSAYGIFQLDAAFPARFVSGLVAYTVVLLQFAFL